MNFRTLALLFVLTLTSSAHAQSNFKKGYVINLPGGDTLRGYINYKERERTPTDFLYKSLSAEKATQTFTIQNTQKVVIEGHETYERFEVSLSMGEQETSRLVNNFTPPDRTDTVFLKVITRGDRVNLYAYRDEVKERFYVLVPPQATPAELNFKLEMQAMQVATTYGYRQQLNQIAAGYPTYSPELKRLIESASYSKAGLKKIVSKINTVNEMETVSGETKYKKGNFFVKAGINYSTLSYTGQNLVSANGLGNNGNAAYKNEIITHSYLPVVSAGYDLYFHPAIQRSYLRTEIMAATFRSKVNSFFKFPSPYDEELTNEYKLFGVFLSLNPQLVYNIYHQKNFKIYAGVGASLRYRFYPTQTLYVNTNKQGAGYSDKVYKNYYKMKSISAVPMASAGAIIKNKFNVSLTWFNTSELTQYFEAVNITSVKEKSVHLSLAYLF